MTGCSLFLPEGLLGVQGEPPPGCAEGRVFSKAKFMV
jgi:hypothetical protein